MILVSMHFFPKSLDSDESLYMQGCLSCEHDLFSLHIPSQGTEEPYFLLYDVTSVEFNSQSNPSSICCRYYANSIRLKRAINLVRHYIILISVALESLIKKKVTKQVIYFSSKAHKEHFSVKGFNFHLAGL